MLDIHARPVCSSWLLCWTPVSIIGPLGHNTSATCPLLSSMNTVNNALSTPALCQSWAAAWGKRGKCFSPWYLTCPHPSLREAALLAALADISILKASHVVFQIISMPWTQLKELGWAPKPRAAYCCLLALTQPRVRHHQNEISGHSYLRIWTQGRQEWSNQSVLSGK